MGAKTAVKLRKRGSAYKCELCGRKLMTSDALAVHQRNAHNIITKRTKSKQVIKPVKPTKVVVKEKTAKKPLATVKSTPKVSEKKVKEAVKVEPSTRDAQPEVKKKTVEFECPKCFRVFLTYFPAHKHIQKYHCINRQGLKVPPNSPSLIQPVRIELCIKCNRKVRSIQTHVCEHTVKEKSENEVFVCTACEEWFPNLKSFDMHVLSLHGNEVESMFFPTNTEFTKWKTEMEAQTNVHYATQDNYNSKKYYHCNFVKEDRDKENTTYFCPSTIVIQEFSKGIQVHFYKQHYKHCFVEYTLTDKYKKYSITSFLKKSDEYNTLPTSANDDNDMYLEFKTLMEGIVIDAAKINIKTLQILIGKALDMTSILTNYDEEVDDNALDVRGNQNMNDTQITKALEDTSIGNKRRNSNGFDATDVKRLKDEDDRTTSSPKILNSFSLANNIDMKNKLDFEDENNKSNIDLNDVKPSNDVEQAPSSFNDSYKDFVVKNFPLKDKRKKVNRTVKTKIGQFKPNSPRSPDSKPLSKSPLNSKSSILTKSSSDTRVLVDSETVNDKSPVSLDSKTESRRSRLSLDKPKVDLVYEVKEQVDGCNILILKI